MCPWACEGVGVSGGPGSRGELRPAAPGGSGAGVGVRPLVAPPVLPSRAEGVMRLAGGISADPPGPPPPRRRLPLRASGSLRCSFASLPLTAQSLPGAVCNLDDTDAFSLEASPALTPGACVPSGPLFWGAAESRVLWGRGFRV